MSEPKSYKPHKKFNPVIYIVLIGYIIMMVDFLFFRRMTNNFTPVPRHGDTSINLAPFGGILNAVVNGQISPLDNLVGNILIFIPAGIYISLFTGNSNLLHNLRLFILCSLFIETIQFLTNTGYADIDDIILNCVGGCSGVAIYKAIYAATMDKGGIERAIALLSIVIGGPIIFVYIFI